MRPCSASPWSSSIATWPSGPAGPAFPLPLCNRPRDVQPGQGREHGWQGTVTEALDYRVVLDTWGRR